MGPHIVFNSHKHGLPLSPDPQHTHRVPRHAVCILLPTKHDWWARHQGKGTSSFWNQNKLKLIFQKDKFLYWHSQRHIHVEIVLERKRKENEATCPISSPFIEIHENVSFPPSTPFSNKGAKEKCAVRLSIRVASENETSRSEKSFQWVVLLVLSLI